MGTTAMQLQGSLIEPTQEERAEADVWPVLVVFQYEPVEPALLSSQARGRRLGGRVLECPVEPLMAAVLLRMPGQDELRVHPDLDPPHVEPGQAVDGLGGESVGEGKRVELG